MLFFFFFFNKEPIFSSIVEKHICFGSNNNLFVGEDDEGSCQCSRSSLQPGGVSMPGAADDWFLFYCFYFSFQWHSRWNRCPARLPDWKPSAPLSFRLIPRRPPRLQAWQPGAPVPSDTRPLAEKRSSAAGCRQVSSFPHDTAIMVHPSLPDGMSVTHGGKSISRVWRETGYVCWQGSDIHPEFGTRGLEFIIYICSYTCHQAVVQ